jgi:hypothetical protein
MTCLLLAIRVVPKARNLPGPRVGGSPRSGARKPWAVAVPTITQAAGHGRLKSKGNQGFLWDCQRTAGAGFDTTGATLYYWSLEVINRHTAGARVFIR